MYGHGLRIDEGHIWHRSSMCIEPVALRANMSAENLQDALVTDPETEQAMFDRRETYDLVVYYDANTESTSFFTRSGLTKTNEPLRYLYDALVDYNQERPLRNMPMLLKGGLQAWTNLLGPQALQSSSTIANRPKAGRPYCSETCHTRSCPHR